MSLWFAFAAVIGATAPGPVAPIVLHTAPFGHRYVVQDDDPRRTRLDTTVSLKADGTVSLDVLNGTVKITRWNRNDVQVRATSPSPASFDFDASASSVNFEAYPNNVTVTVVVPARARVKVQTVGANVTVEDLGGAVDINTVSGKVDVTRSGKWLRIETVSGAVRVVGGEGDVAVNSISGGVTLQDVSGVVSSESVGGAISVTAGHVVRLSLGTVSGKLTFSGTPDPNGRYDIQSHSGAIAIDLPAGAKASIEALSDNGRLRNDYPDARRLPEDAENARTTYRYLLNGGGGRFLISNNSGMITIAKR